MRERAAIIDGFHDLLLSRQDRMLDLVQAETGKSRLSAFEELLDTAMCAHYYARHAAAHLRSRRRAGAVPLVTRTVEHHVPKGVVGIIAPWNYPLTLAVSDAIPALLAGNTVVLKPDSSTPFTALLAVAWLREAGLPAEVLEVVTGPGAALGDPMVDNVDFVMFTGSTATGRHVAQRAAGNLIGCSAELGGKNALLVLDDVDVAASLDGIVNACYSNSGQLCISIERLYVHDAVYDELVPALAERVAGMRIGASTGYDVEMGSLISERQLATVAAHVDDAVAHGATVLAGGRARPDLGPYFYEPTLLAGVDETMTVCRSETFGPVVSVYRVADDDEAVARANDTEYGLNSAVWGRPAHARAVARRLRTGTVNINDGYAPGWASHDAPMGGFGVSGLGRRHGRDGITKYTERLTVAQQGRLLKMYPTGPLTPERYHALMRWAIPVLDKIR
jgi:succinate-semialdehyde dehydrogenase/glutarate-semialdehyde dehydrogenase